MDPTLRSLNLNQLMQLSTGMPQNPALLMGQRGPMPMAPMQEPQEMSPESQHPIYSGSMAGLNAAKQSFKMNEEEKNRALGMAVMQFASNMANSRETNQLSAINQSFNPAVQAYMAEEQRIANQNAYLLEKEHKERLRQQEEMQRLKERAEDLSLKREALNIKNSGLGTQNFEDQSQYIQQLRDSGKIAQNAIPIQFYNPSSRPKLINNQLDRLGKSNEAFNVMKILKEMKELNERFPDLATNISRSLVETSKGKSFYDIAKLKAANKLNPEFVTAAQMFNKLSSDLALYEIKGLGRTTDMMRDVIISTKPDTFMTHDAINNMIEHIYHQYEPIYNDGVNVSEDMAQGVFRPEALLKASKNEKGEKSKSHAKPNKEKSPDQIYENNQKFLQQMEDENNMQDVDVSDATPEEIAEAERLFKLKRGMAE